MHFVVIISSFLAETLQKITALESELARLKAQIAVYALSETQNEQNIPEGTLPYTWSKDTHTV